MDTASLNLKKINAYKKKLCWGDVPANYHLLSGALGELDGILSHGFSSAYTELLNKKNWNLALLEGDIDPRGNISVKIKPQISLRHYYENNEYELHCFPMLGSHKVYSELNHEPLCPFTLWSPNVSQRLFKINHLLPFIAYTFSKGDEADMQLVKFSFVKVEQLINHLKESFEIIDIEGLSIAEFCQQLTVRKKHYDHENNDQQGHEKTIKEVINEQNKYLE